MKRVSILSDMAQMASGAASAFGGIRGEIDVMIQSQIEKILAKRGLVSREDFDAAEARITALGARIEKLESQLEALASKPTGKGTSKTTEKS